MRNIQDKDMGLLDICKLLGRLKKTSLSVGVFSEAVNNEGHNRTYVADYAINNEYRNEHIPERSFIRSTMDENQDKWSKLMSNILDDTAAGNLKEVGGELYKIGEIARKDIINKIDSNINPPNSLATLKRKGMHKNKTLIDNGVLRSSIEARIIEK